MAKRTKKRRGWTSAEVRELKAMAKRKTPASRIAKKLKRTEGATRQRRSASGCRWIPVPKLHHPSLVSRTAPAAAIPAAAGVVRAHALSALRTR